MASVFATVIKKVSATALLSLVSRYPRFGMARGVVGGTGQSLRRVGVDASIGLSLSGNRTHRRRHYDSVANPARSHTGKGLRNSSVCLWCASRSCDWTRQSGLLARLFTAGFTRTHTGKSFLNTPVLLSVPLSVWLLVWLPVLLLLA